jgi:Flp pilus assembly protein TadG
MERDERRGARGQIIPLFALTLVAIVAMVGLVLDGGSTFAQRRSEQNAVDLAALAAANDLIVNQGSATWDATARSVATQNGYTDGVNGASVSVTCKNCPGQATDASAAGVQVTVTITAPHPNTFTNVIGISNWNVSTTATAETGWPDTSTGPAPFIVSKTAFNGEGKATSCQDKDHQCDLTHPVSDTPTTPADFTFTNFGYNKLCQDPGNVNDAQLQAYLAGRASFSITLQVGCYIAQHNNGVMNNTVAALQAMAPTAFAVPVVDVNGDYVGWTTFMMTGANANGRNGTITGYYVDGTSYFNQTLDVSGSGFGNSTFGGSYVLKLVN